MPITPPPRWFKSSTWHQTSRVLARRSMGKFLLSRYDLFSTTHAVVKLHVTVRREVQRTNRFLQVTVELPSCVRHQVHGLGLIRVRLACREQGAASRKLAARCVCRSGPFSVACNSFRLVSFRRFSATIDFVSIHFRFKVGVVPGGQKLASITECRFDEFPNGTVFNKRRIEKQ